LLKKVKDKKLEIKTLMVKSQISSNIELKRKIEMKNHIHKRIKNKRKPISNEVNDDGCNFYSFLNDWSQLDSTIRTSDMEYEARLQHKKQI